MFFRKLLAEFLFLNRAKLLLVQFIVWHSLFASSFLSLVRIISKNNSSSHSWHAAFVSAKKQTILTRKLYDRDTLVPSFGMFLSCAYSVFSLTLSETYVFYSEGSTEVCLFERVHTLRYSNINLWNKKVFWKRCTNSVDDN